VRFVSGQDRRRGHGVLRRVSLTRDDAATLTEADSGKAGAFAVASEDNFVAVFEEGAGFSVGELEWGGASLCDFEE